MITYSEWNQDNDLFLEISTQDPSLFIFTEIPPEVCRVISLNRFGDRNMLPVYVGQKLPTIVSAIRFELKDLFAGLEHKHHSDELNLGSKSIDFREKKLSSLEEESYLNVSAIKESKKVSYDTLYKNIKNASDISMIYLAVKSIINFLTIEVY